MKSRWKIGLVAAALLVNAPQASADLKSVFTAVCVSGRRCPPRNCRPHDPARQPTPEVCPFVPPECRTLMLCMDKAGWHVIHDTRYAGAWFDLRVGTPGLPLYKLIFQKD